MSIRALALRSTPTGSAYVAGSTLSPNFPTTAGAYQTTPASGLPAPPIFAPHRYDAFVTKLAATGSLVYSTYLGGGSNAEVGADIAVDTAGNAYVTGTTRSVDYPTTPGAFQTVNDVSSEAAYVTKLNATGSSLLYSTYLSGSHHEFGSGIAVDAAGNAYVTGGTQSVDFPITANAAQPVLGGDADAFITKFDPAGTAVIYSTYLGSSGQEWADDIAIDPGGNAYVTGTTRSTDFPTTAGVFQPAFGGGFYDTFVAKVDPVGGGTRVLELPRRQRCRVCLGHRGGRGGQRLRHRLRSLRRLSDHGRVVPANVWRGARCLRDEDRRAGPRRLSARSPAEARLRSATTSARSPWPCSEKQPMNPSPATCSTSTTRPGRACVP